MERTVLLVRSSWCSIKLLRPTWHVSDRATGRTVLQSRAQLTSSVLWKNLWHICWRTVTRIKVDPRFWGGKTDPNFSTCMRVHTVNITRSNSDNVFSVLLRLTHDNTVTVLMLIHCATNVYPGPFSHRVEVCILFAFLKNWLLQTTLMFELDRSVR